MKVVLDTNVVASGVFFSGPPHAILVAWQRGVLDVFVTPEILTEYRRVIDNVAKRHPRTDLSHFEVLMSAVSITTERVLPIRVCTDPDDDKFLACALASGTKVICSGDAALCRVSGYAGIEVLTPRQFVDTYLR